MNLQTIKSINGQDEYVLLPVTAYHLLKTQINKALKHDYEAFNLQEYIQNPIALARIRAHLTQAELAKKLHVTQAYISRIENQTTVPAKLLEKMEKIIVHSKST